MPDHTPPIANEQRDATGPIIDLRGTVTVITGGTKGVGRGIAERFLAVGADVVVTARNEPDEPIEVDGRTAAFTPADVRDADQAAALIAFARDTFGHVDTVINNAGGSPFALADTASPRFSEAIIKLNLLAPLHVAQAANAVMQAQPRGGSIINIASVSGVRPSPGTVAYGAAKAGLISMTTTLGVEWAPKVRVNAITAGLIVTEQAHLHYGDDEGIAAVGTTIPMGRMGTPRDIADACLFLASPLSSYVTGSNLLVHGGGERPAFLGAANAD
jgi:NAD(P)-dependent dehydrogenase (short-subunit alcohol dehydrogenase family)